MSTIQTGNALAYFAIDSAALKEKYHGCGAALAKVQLRFEGKRRFLHDLVDFDYIDCDEDGESTLTIQAEQSVNMCSTAGSVQRYEDVSGNVIVSDCDNFADGFEKIEGGVFAFVIVNLSCYQACLG